MSAYEIALNNGFSGTEAQWLASLKGKDSGKSAYEIAKEQGFDGSVEEWLESLKGEDGTNGTNGIDGKDGEDVSVEALYQKWLETNSGSYNDFLSEYLGAVVINNTTASYVSRSILSIVNVYSSFVKTEQVYVSEGFFGGHYEEESTPYSSAGSGVIYRLDREKGDAYIITNYHVVFDKNANTANHVSDDIVVYIYGMQSSKDYAIKATYIGGSLNYDIAVLKVTDSDILKNSDARAVDVFDSNNLIVGETTLAIGNPQAGGISVTQGVLSVDSEYMTMKGADNVTDVTFRTLRTDTPINEGNSGGGLFNDKGELIGIVNAKIIISSVENIGYAIPSNIATYVADNIIDNCEGKDNTKVKKCMFGIVVEIVGSKAVYDKIEQVTRIVETVKIKEIKDTSLVKGEGLAQVGDTIKYLKINDKTYETTRQFMIIDAMLTVRPGDDLTLVVERDGVEGLIEIKVKATEGCIEEIE